MAENNEKETSESSTNEQAAQAPAHEVSFGGISETVHENSTEEMSSAAALIRLALIVFVGCAAAYWTGSIKTLLVVGAVIVMIAVHELGHFMTAKWAGMKVDQYFLGFGPKLWSIQKGETEYGIKLLPAGAYVRIIGMTNSEQVDPAEESRTYRAKSYPRRLSVAVAGSFMHFVMAYLILVVLFVFIGVPHDTSTQIGRIIKFPSEDSPAQIAGLKPNDRIISYDGIKLNKWEEFPPYAQKHVGVPIQLVIQRKSETKTFTVTPVDRWRLDPEGAKTTAGCMKDLPCGFVGMQTKPAYKTMSFFPALSESGKTLWDYSKATVKLIGKIFSPSGVESYVSNLHKEDKTKPAEQQTRFVSPVGIVSYANDAAKAGWAQVLSLLFSINVFVGIFNMVPLLPFDGGHVAVATYERIRSRKGKRYMADSRKLLAVSVVVTVILVAIGLSALYLDIVRPPSNPFQ